MRLLLLLFLAFLLMAAFLPKEEGRQLDSGAGPGYVFVESR